MIVFTINGSKEVGEKVGTLFEKGYFNNLTGEIHTFNRKDFVGNVGYFGCDRFICDYDDIEVFNIRWIGIQDAHDYCFYVEDLHRLSVESLENKVKAIFAESPDTPMLDGLGKGPERLHDEIDESLRKFTEACKPNEKDKPSTLDIVLEEAANSQNKNNSNNLNSSYQTCTGYNDARIVLISMISDYLNKGNQVVSSGVYYAHEIKQYVAYVIAI